MTEPISYEEYKLRFHANKRIFGAGIDTSMGMPCPFCAAPDFMVFRIVECTKVWQAGATCKECNRSARGMLVRPPGSVQVEFVQTGGPNQPAWLQPQMRRVAA